MSRNQLEKQTTKLPSTKVVEAVAALKDTEPTELERPLYTVVDPDSLNTLFTPKRDETARTVGEIHFTYCGCSIIVTPSGDVNAVLKGELLTR